MRPDCRLVDRKRWLHNTTLSIVLLTVLAPLPKVLVAMLLAGTNCDMRILLLPLLECRITTKICRCRLTHSREGNKLWRPATIGCLPANAGRLMLEACSERIHVTTVSRLRAGTRKSKARPLRSRQFSCLGRSKCSQLRDHLPCRPVSLRGRISIIVLMGKYRPSLGAAMV
jgi:hypothetical protein